MTKIAVFPAIAMLAFSALPASAQTTVDHAVQPAGLKAKESEVASSAEIGALRQRINSLEFSRRADQKTYDTVAAALRTSPAGSAMAAVPSAPVVANPPSWAGFYLGAGYGRERSRIDHAGLGTATIDAFPRFTFDAYQLESRQYTNNGHVLAGYLAQFGNVLIGAEGDYTFGQRSLWDRPFGPEGGGCGVGTTGNFICGQPSVFGQVETLGHLRAIAGYEITPNLMGFVSGGAAFAHSKDVGAHVGFTLASSPGAPALTSADSVSPNKLLVGTSFGGGIQAKVTPNIVARLEYLQDRYSLDVGPAAVQATVSGTTVAMSVPGGKANITNETIRGSLIYRFDPNGPNGLSANGALLDLAQFTTAPELYANTWAGFYAGGGFTQNNYRIRSTDAGSFSFYDVNTNTSYSNRFDLARTLDSTGGHILIGYRAQLNRFWLGIEADLELESLDRLTSKKSPGQFGGDAGRGQTCYFFPPSTACFGLAMAGDLSVESKNHVRFQAGFVVTPQLSVFASSGWSYGEVAGSIGATAGGMVISSPSSPLVGAARVTRQFDLEQILGSSIGVGAEFKASDNFFVRGEYLRDTYVWNHAPIGGAGFGGTIGNLTTNSFASAGSSHRIVNEAYRVSLVYRMWNPQAN